jgi:RNA polymerase sigma factor for flagellar operon FliA
MQLEDELGRSPTDEELAQKLDMSQDEVQELMKKSAVLSLVSLDDYMEQNYETSFSPLVASRTDSPEEQMELKARREMLAEAINKLSEQEKLVVTLYYFEDLTLMEIGSIMKLTGSRVSQIHTKALTKLQGKLGRYKNLLFV